VNKTFGEFQYTYSEYEDKDAIEKGPIELEN